MQSFSDKSIFTLESLCIRLLILKRLLQEVTMQAPSHIITFLKSLRDEIIRTFETLEPKHRFERQQWEHTTGGGGEISQLRGTAFEKAAVNWSHVWGDNFPMDDSKGPFVATGISLITHMANPHAPTVHMNVRYIETSSGFWFGGGYDLTPMGFPYPEDTIHFHEVAKGALEPFGKEIYPNFSQSAKEYFFIPHRNKERGVGGIFFDHYNTGNFERDLALWQAIGKSFTETVMPIYSRRIGTPFTENERDVQLRMRAHYAEFNLLYDRGTKFGFLSKGNPDAILCSMPPLVKW
jgi:coproporphyrinogen III oxidase